MSNHLAQSQQPSSRRHYHRLRFRSITDAAEEQGEITVKVPVSKHDKAKYRSEWQGTQKIPQRPQRTQKQLEKAPLAAQIYQQAEEKASLEDKLENVQKEETIRLSIVEQHDMALLETRRVEIFAFDTLKANKSQAIADSNNVGFEEVSTIPMIVLKGIAEQQGKPQGVMKSEVSGAANAAGLVGIGNIIGSVLKYVSTFLIQYSLGPGLYGLYTLGLSIITLISAIFSLGLDDAMTRYVAIYRGKQQTNTLQGLMVFCTMLGGIAGIAGALLLLFFTPSLVAFWSTLRPGQAIGNKQTLVQMTPLLQLMAPMIPLLCMQVVWFGGLRGFKAFKWRVLATSILQPVVQIVLLLVIIRLFRGVVGVALVMLISTILTTGLYLYFLNREYTREAKPKPEKYELREWLIFSTLNFLTTIIETVLDSIDTLLLAFFGVSKVAIGQYGAAIKFGPLITMPLGTFNTIFAPTIAELHSKGEKKKLEEMFKIVTKWSITFSLPIFLVVVLFSSYLLALSGQGYINAWPLVIAFSIGSMFGAGTGAVGSMLLMTGHNKLSFLNSIVAVVINLVLGILLTPRYGAMGTALSTGLAICANNVMRLIQVRLLLKMQPYRWDTLKPMGAGLISSVIMGGVLYLLSHSHIHDTFMIGHAIVSLELGLIPIFLAGYAGLLFLFKVSPEDEIVLSALRQKFKRFRKHSA